MPVMHDAIELLVGHLADAGVAVGRDVGRVDLAERRIHAEAAGHRLAARRGVAGNAIAGGGEVFALGDQRGLIAGGGGPAGGGLVAAHAPAPQGREQRCTEDASRGGG